MSGMGADLCRFLFAVAPAGAGEGSMTDPGERFQVGDTVRHFKGEDASPTSAEYHYRILAFASHTETGERLVVYQALYEPFRVFARPYAQFVSEVDRRKYPHVRQKHRFEIVSDPSLPEPDPGSGACCGRVLIGRQDRI